MKASATIKALELLGVVHSGSDGGVLLLKLSQLPRPSTPCGVRDDVLVELIVEAGMNEDLQSSPENESPYFIGFHPGLCEVVRTSNEAGLYCGFTFLAHDFPP